MDALFELISKSSSEFGLLPTIVYLGLALLVMYFLNGLSKQTKMSSDNLAQVIKDNRDMSEKQLEILNTLVGKITVMVDFTQALVGHVLEKDGE